MITIGAQAQAGKGTTEEKTAYATEALKAILEGGWVGCRSKDKDARWLTLQSNGEPRER